MYSINRNQLFLAAALLAATVLLACRKNADDALEILSAAEAAEIAENAVASRSAGAVMPAEDMAELLENALGDCGIPGDTSFQRSSTAGPVTYNYLFNLGWLINCNNLGVPQDAQLSVTGNGAFNTQRWSGSDATTGNLTFAGLNPPATTYTVNGSYKLDGALTGKLRNIDPTLDVEITVNLTNLTIRKSDRLITGGTGTVVIVATNARGRTETLDGTLVFNGDGTATVTVNGHSHTFTL